MAHERRSRSSSRATACCLFCRGLISSQAPPLTSASSRNPRSAGALTTPSAKTRCPGCRTMATVSSKAIEQGLPALMERFGRVPLLAAMALDERESVRACARDFVQSEQAQPAKASTRPKSTETFKARYRPLLAILQPVLADVPYEPPAPRASPLPAVAGPLSCAPSERDIRANPLYRQLQRERNEWQAEREGLTKDRDRLSNELQVLTVQCKALRARLDSVEGDWRMRVAQGIADGLNKRLAPWLSASEALALPGSHQTDPLERARQLLARQAQEDKRYGTRSAVGQQLSEAQRLLAALQEAQAEALRPLPQLGEEQRALATHIEALQTRLAHSSIQPTHPSLRQLGQALLAIHEMDELQEKKRQVERSMYAEAWSLPMCQQAYDLLDRRAMHIYDLHHPASGVHKDEHPPVTPNQHFEYALRHAQPIRLIIDGHNMLPKLKPLMGAEYFSPQRGPNARVRALLIDRVRQLTELHPLLSADIFSMVRMTSIGAKPTLCGCGFLVDRGATVRMAASSSLCRFSAIWASLWRVLW